MQAIGERATHARSLTGRSARRDFSLLDYRWSFRWRADRRLSLQQLLDPGEALQHMPAPLQSAQAPSPELPSLASLHTAQHFPEPPQELPLQPTLEDSVIDGLIDALYEVLPDALNEPLAETTLSGSRIGRHGYARRSRPESLWVPAPNHSETLEESPAEMPHEATPAAALPPPEPKPYVMGAVPEGMIEVTFHSLSELPLSLPAPQSAGLLSAQMVLGRGEACFLRAQSALWSWRTHRQTNMEVYAEGPPSPGRNALLEQKIGPITLLLGCRVTGLIEEDRRWGFTLGSLSGQVLRSREHFLVDWQPDDTVLFTLETQQQLAMPSLSVLGPVYSALRRRFKQGYIRNILELTAE